MIQKYSNIYNRRKDILGIIKLKKYTKDIFMIARENTNLLCYPKLIILFIAIQKKSKQIKNHKTVFGQQMQRSMYKMNKQQGPTVQHREVFYTVINHDGKEYKKEIYIYAQLKVFLCTAEINSIF